MLLDENAIYTLPDGREFIARSATHGGYFLHDRLRGASVVPVYLVDRSGQLLSWGRVSRWTAKDLRETGRLSQPAVARMRVV